MQRALTAARASSGADEIWVANGVYYPVPQRTDPNDPIVPDRSVSFHFPIDVKVYGGFAGGETSLAQRNESANETILDGDIDALNGPTVNSFHVVFYDDADHTTTKLSGFTIRNGYAYDSSDPTHGTKNVGGGIFLAGSLFGDGPSLERLKISGNNAYTAGGGLYNAAMTQPYLTSCRFEFNNVLQSGGQGGAVSLKVKGTGAFQNCVFYDNDSNGLGGAVAVTCHFAGPVFANCTFNANTATGVTLNGAVRYGHSIYCDFTADVYNTISWGNGGAGQLQLDGPTSSVENYFYVKYSARAKARPCNHY